MLTSRFVAIPSTTVAVYSWDSSLSVQVGTKPGAGSTSINVSSIPTTSSSSASFDTQPTSVASLSSHVSNGPSTTVAPFMNTSSASSTTAVPTSTCTDVARFTIGVSSNVVICYLVSIGRLNRCSSMIYRTSRQVRATSISLRSSIHTGSCTGNNISAMCHHPPIPFRLFLHLSLQYTVSTITPMLMDLPMLVMSQLENLAPDLDHRRAHIGSMRIRHI